MNETMKFVVAEEMPCAPNQIKVWFWGCPDTLGKAELEEVAARLISFSQKLDEWTGVTWAEIAQQLTEETKVAVNIEQALLDYDRRMDSYRRLNFWTCGIYGKYVPVPMRPIFDENAKPASIFSWQGPMALVHTLMKMRDEGLVRCEDAGKNVVFYPTPALIERIMQAQAC